MGVKVLLHSSYVTLQNIMLHAPWNRKNMEKTTVTTCVRGWVREGGLQCWVVCRILEDVVQRVKPF